MCYLGSGNQVYKVSEPGKPGFRGVRRINMLPAHHVSEIVFDVYVRTETKTLAWGFGTLNV